MANPFSGVIDALKRLVQAVLGAVTRFFSTLFSAESSIVDNINRLHDNFVQFKANLEVEIEQLKNFKFDPQWKTRVIHVPTAIQHIKDLIEEYSNGWKEKFEKLREPIHSFVLIFHAEQSEAGSPQEAVSGLAKTAVKIDEVATLIQQLADASDVVIEVEEMFTKLRDQIEHLDAVFLQQSNPREKLSVLSPGADPHVRVGNLHG
jgi:sugar-specific transcriptional regulator TrmB